MKCDHCGASASDQGIVCPYFGRDCSVCVLKYSTLCKPDPLSFPEKASVPAKSRVNLSYYMPKAKEKKPRGRCASSGKDPEKNEPGDSGSFAVLDTVIRKLKAAGLPSHLCGRVLFTGDKQFEEETLQFLGLCGNRMLPGEKPIMVAINSLPGSGVFLLSSERMICHSFHYTISVSHSRAGQIVSDGRLIGVAVEESVGTVVHVIAEANSALEALICAVTLEDARVKLGHERLRVCELQT